MMEEFESHDASPNARRREVTVSRLKDAIEEKNPEQLTQAIRAAENASLTAKSHRAVLSQARRNRHARARAGSSSRHDTELRHECRYSRRGMRARLRLHRVF